MRKALAALLALALVLASPGLEGTRAFAANFQGKAGVPGVPSAVPQVSLPQLPVSAIPSAALPNALPHSAIPGAIPAAPSISNVVPGAQAVPGVAGPAATVQEQLRQGALRVEESKSGDAKQGELDALFTGAKSFGSVVEGPSGSGSGAPAEAGLSRLSISDLSGIARDAKKPAEDRRAAVKALADRSDDPAKLALEEIGTAKGGSSADYEIKRAALRRLAEKGKLLSLPPVSDEHKAELLAQLSKQKPAVAAFDYDGTLEESGKPATAETGEVLKNLADSGVETMILTDRALIGRRKGDVGLLDSISTLTNEQRASIAVGAQRGARIVAFNADGAPQLVSEAAAWTEGEKAILAAAAQRVAMENGSSLVDGQRTIFTDYDFALFLPADASDAQASAAAQRLRETLAELKLNAHVVPRRADRAGVEIPVPYVTVSKYDKSLGMSKLRALRETFGRLRDAERLPAFMRGAARKILAKLPAKASPADSALIVGDKMLGEKGIDLAMAAGAPGALTISVGESMDPRVDNGFLWPTQGHAGTMELARAASAPAAPQMEGMNWKAFGGLFSARTASIVAFLGTTLAYAKVAIGAVGPTSYGTLAALGGLVAVAAGPLSGRLADKFSARNGMALNAVLRAVFLLDLPLFSLLGWLAPGSPLAFAALLAGSVANGWLLSSIMTMEGAYLRRLFGFKNLRTANSLLQLNYFALQIVFGLILGIGKLVDGHNLMIPFYIAAAVNLLVVLPITWKTMPNEKPAQAAPAPAQTQTPAAAKTPFLKKYWKEALVLGASIATFPFLHLALPITAALVYWITRTEGFKAVKADKAVFKGVALVSLGAFVFYALQTYALPTIATALVGQAASSLMQGKLLGAVFLGQMISSSSMAQLPVIRVPFIGRFGAQKLVQGAVLAMTALWVYTGLIPGSILAAAAFTAAAFAMMFASRYMTDKGWIAYTGVGLGFLALPALFWGNVPILLGSLAVMGYFFGPATVALNAYVQRRAPPEKIGQIMGIQGSLFNAAISLGIGTLSLVAGFMTPMFPGTLWALAAIASVAGVIYFLGSRTLPGLPARVFDNNGGRK